MALALAETMPHAGGLHPLLRFVTDLAQQSEERVAKPLVSWVDRVAHRRNESASLRAFRAGPKPAKVDRGPLSITVMIVPGAQEPDRYLVTVWRQEGDTGWAKSYCDERASHRVEDLRRVLSAEVKSALRHLRGRAMVEFMVPPELFDFDFENLEIGRSSLGRMNAVVLRDLERLDALETWDAWRARWDQLRNNTAASESPHCTVGHDLDEFDVLVRGKPALATLVLPSPPARADNDLLGVAIYAGLPAAVWPRRGCAKHRPDESVSAAHPCSGQEFQHRFEQDRQGQGNTSLPALIQSLRVSADWQRRDVVVLWDDPDRVPEEGAALVEPRTRSMGEA